MNVFLEVPSKNRHYSLDKAPTFAVLPPPPHQAKDVAVEAALPQHVPAVPHVQPSGPLQHRPTHRLAPDVHPVQLGLNTRTD